MDRKKHNLGAKAMTTSVTDDRQAFEAWAVAEKYDVRIKDAPGASRPGEYCNLYTHCAWDAWEAAIRSQGKVERCPYCDGTGDVHSLDGEWRGECSCGAAQFNRLREIAYRDEAKSVTVRADDLRAVLTAIIGEGD